MIKAYIDENGEINRIEPLENGFVVLPFDISDNVVRDKKTGEFVPFRNSSQALEKLSSIDKRKKMDDYTA